MTPRWPWNQAGPEPS